MVIPTFWARLRMKNINLHDLSVVDAALVALSWMESVYPDESKRVKEYQRIAAIMRIPVEEDPELVAERHRREMQKVLDEFGGDLD